MANKYRFTLKSEEQRGAGGYNGVYISLADDGDALIFAGNLEAVASCNVASVDSEIASNYALPYPSGTANVVRLVMRDATGAVFTQQLYNVLSTFVPETFAANLISAGIQMPGTGNAVTSIVCTMSTPQASV